MGQMRRKLKANLPAEVIEAFGGLASLQQALGHKHPSTIHSWKRRGRIPPWRYRDIREAAEARGDVTLPKEFNA